MAAIRPIRIDNFNRYEVKLLLPQRLVWRARLGVAVMRFGAWIATVGFTAEDYRGG